MVNIIEDWDVLEEYAGEKLGFYQLLASDEMFEIRVQTGRVGFKKSLETAMTRLLLAFVRKELHPVLRQKGCVSPPQFTFSYFVYANQDLLLLSLG